MSYHMDHDNRSGFEYVDVSNDPNETKLHSKSSLGGKAPEKRRREAHALIEKRRRGNISEGFMHLQQRVPNARDSHGSKAEVLRKAAGYIDYLEQELEKTKQELARMRRE